jgi:hypothetical protein
MESKKFLVTGVFICVTLALLAVPFIGASATPTPDEAATVGCAPGTPNATTDGYPSLKCTGGIATGLTSLVGNMNGQVGDMTVGFGDWLPVSLIIPKEGNRYLAIGGGMRPLLNEKGVSLTGQARPAQKFPPYSGTPEYISGAELMKLSDSAAEYVRLWSENVTEYGVPGGSSSTFVVDPKEAYLLEAANFVYGDPANHAIHGPMTDTVFAHANFFVTERLKGRAELGLGAGYTRAQRLWELLIAHQYDSITLQPSPPAPGSGVSLAYFMSSLRDHGNISPEEGRMSAYAAEERGEGAVCVHGTSEYTCVGWINVARPDHTNLFSCTWMTLGQPCTSPFIPFYIGINDVPQVVSEEGNPVSKLFGELRLAIERHPEYREEITKYWTVFEIQAIEESYGVEREAAKLADAGKEKEARKLLTKFCEKKCNEAMEAGQKTLDFLNGLPMFPEASGAGSPSCGLRK